MINILYRLQALYQFYKSAHWLAKGKNFYSDHLLFGRLYEGMDQEMDTLVELLLSVTEIDEKDLHPKKVLEEASKLVPSFGNNIEIAAGLEEDLLKQIEKIKVDSVPVGLYNHLAGIAQSHTSKGYLLHRALS